MDRTEVITTMFPMHSSAFALVLIASCGTSAADYCERACLMLEDGGCAQPSVDGDCFGSCMTRLQGERRECIGEFAEQLECLIDERAETGAETCAYATGQCYAPCQDPSEELCGGTYWCSANTGGLEPIHISEDCRHNDDARLEDLCS